VPLQKKKAAEWLPLGVNLPEENYNSFDSQLSREK
jgi:hypothetical protein